MPFRVKYLSGDWLKYLALITLLYYSDMNLSNRPLSLICQTIILRLICVIFRVLTLPYMSNLL